MVLIAPLVALLVLWVNWGRGEGFRIPRLPLLLASLHIAATLLLLPAAMNPSAAFTELRWDLLFGLAFLLGLREGSLGPWTLLRGLVATGWLITLILLGERLTGLSIAGASLGSTTLGNPNFSGALLALSFAGTLAAIPGCPSTRAKRFLAASLVVFGLALWWLNSISAIAAAGLSSLWLILVLLHRSRGLRATIPAAVLAAALVLLLSQSLAERAEGRLYMNRINTCAATTQPLTGVGLGGFPRAFLDCQAPVLDAEVELRRLWTRPDHAHNEFFHLAVERGLGSLIILVVFWILTLARIRRAPSLIPGGVVISVLVLAQGEFPFHLVPTSLTAGLAAGLLWQGQPLPAPRTIPRWVTTIPAILLILGVSWQGVGDTLLATGRYQASLKANPWEPMAAFQLGKLLESVAAPEACPLLERAATLHASPALAAAVGTCLFRQGVPAAARTWLGLAVHWNQRNAQAHANLALVLERLGALDAARAHLQRARSLRPGDGSIRKIERHFRRNHPTENEGTRENQAD